MTKEEHLLEDIDTLRNYIEANNIEIPCDYVDDLCTDALELLKKQEAVKPNRGLLDNYYCGICGSMITASIKIFDGERYMIGHPDHLKPEHKWKYCKNCGTAVKWDE